METASFCGQCGTRIPAGNKFCTSCGTPSGVHAAVTPAIAAAALSGDDTAAGTPATSEPTPAVAANGHGTPTGTAVPPGPAAAEDAFDESFQDNEPTAARRADEPTRRFVPRAAASRPAPPPPPVSPVSSAQPSPRGKDRWALIGGVAVVMVAVVVVLVLLLAGGSGDKKTAAPAPKGPSAATVYKQQVAKAFGPVLGANMKVSARLESLKGTKPDSARLAVREAQQAATAATGALGALMVPPGQKALADAGRQVLDREVAYLAAVASVLNHPTVAGASQLQTLSSNLTSALHAAGPTIAGEQETVSGADRLTSWARTTSRTLNRRAAAKRAKAKKTQSSSSSSSSSSPTASTPGGTPCGDGVYAGANTSCAFALNVRDAYYDAPGVVASVRVYSPVTNETYVMDCRPSGSGTTCSGANNASVTF